MLSLGPSNLFCSWGSGSVTDGAASGLQRNPSWKKLPRRALLCLGRAPPVPWELRLVRAMPLGARLGPCLRLPRQAAFF